ncbi:uncharacterized protein AMSG_07559 [Thecamonas trahens ATCC 50062]|uniref:Dynein heavy chain n=1 Tax=Thecamonas trahens ATCC 50062 TaxID=461836 RepID=A0A0L0DJ72_THETB|nr:hypothetical protein AMSG_07559 [Thecamonas trahens ATCC 50062]KNC51378.1 hypothetical protein AMSG_07559 [Thecamonas trahens ATCC 50062]|eukprot:XP_013756046.1 hypothetical protein AMSG_07559 [Thecamonas trahens ATCC 50062]
MTDPAAPRLRKVFKPLDQYSRVKLSAVRLHRHERLLTQGPDAPLPPPLPELAPQAEAEGGTESHRSSRLAPSLRPHPPSPRPRQHTRPRKTDLGLAPKPFPNNRGLQQPHPPPAPAPAPAPSSDPRYNALLEPLASHTLPHVPRDAAFNSVPLPMGVPPPLRLSAARARARAGRTTIAPLLNAPVSVGTSRGSRATSRSLGSRAILTPIDPPPTASAALDDFPTFLPLDSFDAIDAASRPPSERTARAERPDVPPASFENYSNVAAVSKFFRHDGSFEWMPVRVLGFDPDKNLYLVEFVHTNSSKYVSRFNLVFDGEDTGLLDDRRREALALRDEQEHWLRLLYYVNDMPSPPSLSMPRTQLERILTLAAVPPSHPSFADLVLDMQANHARGQKLAAVKSRFGADPELAAQYSALNFALLDTRRPVPHHAMVQLPLGSPGTRSLVRHFDAFLVRALSPAVAALNAIRAECLAVEELVLFNTNVASSPSVAASGLAPGAVLELAAFRTEQRAVSVSTIKHLRATWRERVKHQFELNLPVIIQTAALDTSLAGRPAVRMRDILLRITALLMESAVRGLITSAISSLDAFFAPYADVPDFEPAALPNAATSDDLDWSALLHGAPPFAPDLDSLPSSTPLLRIARCLPEPLFVTTLVLTGFHAHPSKANESDPLWDAQHDLIYRDSYLATVAAAGESSLSMALSSSTIAADLFLVGEQDLDHGSIEDLHIAVPEQLAEIESTTPADELAARAARARAAHKDSLVRDTVGLALDPPLSAFETMLTSVMDDILAAADKVPLIDSEVTGNPALFSKYLASVDPTSPDIAPVLTGVMANLRANFALPRELLARLTPYTAYIRLYTQRAAFEAAIIDMAPSLDQYAALVRAQRDRAAAVRADLPDLLAFGLFEINLKPAKTVLAAMAESLARLVLRLLHAEARDDASLVRASFKDLNAKLHAPTETPEDWKAMKHVMANLDDTVAGHVSRIRAMLAKYDTLESFGFRIDDSEAYLKWDAVRWPRRISEQVIHTQNALADAERIFQQELADKQKAFALQAIKLEDSLREAEGYGDLDRAPLYLSALRTLKRNVDDAVDIAATFNDHESIFGHSLTSYAHLVELAAAVAPFLRLWDIAATWDDTRAAWLEDEFVSLSADAMQNQLDAWLDDLTSLGEAFIRLAVPRAAVRTLRAQITAFAAHMPVISALLAIAHLAPQLRNKHWAAVTRATGQDFVLKQDTDLAYILANYSFAHCMPELEAVARAARAERRIDDTLRALWQERYNFKFDVLPHRETHSYVLDPVAVEDIAQRNEEHILKVEALRSSPHIAEFSKRLAELKAEFDKFSRLLDGWLTLQRHWTYLQPVFASDISHQLRDEAREFERVDKFWRRVMDAIHDSSSYSSISTRNYHESFEKMNTTMERVKASLTGYLNVKRSTFPRFFFLCDGELLELLALSAPSALIPSLPKLFSGLHHFATSPISPSITHMASSSSAPLIELHAPVPLVNAQLEAWLAALTRGMVSTLSHIAVSALASYPGPDNAAALLAWAAPLPPQLVILVERIAFATTVEAVAEPLLPLSAARESALIDVIANALRAPPSSGSADALQPPRSTLEVMLLLHTYFRAVYCELLVPANPLSPAKPATPCTPRTPSSQPASPPLSASSSSSNLAALSASQQVGSAASFLATAEPDVRAAYAGHLRFYADTTDTTGRLAVSARQYDAELSYDFELVPPHAPLAITPPERGAVAAATSALVASRLVAITGEHSTGKTRTALALAPNLGRYHVVYSGSPCMHYVTLTNLFKGAAAAGALLVINDVDRLTTGMMAVAAQLLGRLLRARAAGKAAIAFEGSDALPLAPSMGVVLTAALLSFSPPFHSTVVHKPRLPGAAPGDRQWSSLSASPLESLVAFESAQSFASSPMLAADAANAAEAGDAAAAVPAPPAVAPGISSLNVALYSASHLSPLPPALKAASRTIALAAPSLHAIASANLACAGLVHAATLATKLAALAELVPAICARSVLRVCRLATAMWRSVESASLLPPQAYTHEATIVVAAVRMWMAPRLDKADMQSFEDALAAAFPRGCEASPHPGLAVPRHVPLLDATAAAAHAKDLGLEATPQLLACATALCDAAALARGVMLVGSPASGKSAALALFRAHLAAVGGWRVAAVYPASLTYGQLYGSINPSTGVWVDGLVAHLVRAAAAASAASGARTLIVFDGPLSAHWVRPLFDLLGAHPVLCLDSGERVLSTPDLHLVFETESLDLAPPSLVAQSAIVRTPGPLSWRLLVAPALARFEREYGPQMGVQQLDVAATLTRLLVDSTLVAKAVSVRGAFTAVASFLALLGSELASYRGVDLSSSPEFGRLHPLPSSETALAARLEALVLFAAVNTLGALPVSSARTGWISWLGGALSSFGIELDALGVETVAQLADVVPNPNATAEPHLVSWADYAAGRGLFVTMPVVGTPIRAHRGFAASTVRVQYLTSKLLNAGHHASGFQLALDRVLTRKRKNVWGPIAHGQTRAILADDFEFRMEEGALGELLRQWHDTGGWHDATKPTTFRFVESIQFVLASLDADADPLPPRLAHRFVTLAVEPPSHDELVVALAPAVAVHLHTAHKLSSLDLRSLSKPLVGGTLALYHDLALALPASHARPHYAFNIRHVVKVLDGLVLAVRGGLESVEDVLEAWHHELRRVFADGLVELEHRTWVARWIATHGPQLFAGIADAQVLAELFASPPRLFNTLMPSVAKDHPYAPVASGDSLLDVVDNFVTELNASTQTPLKRAFLMDAVSHISRLNRVFSLQRSHAVLVGATAAQRTSLARLAAVLSHVAQRAILELSATLHSDEVEWRKLLSSALLRAGGLGLATVLIVDETQLAAECVLADLAIVINSGHVPITLFTEEQQQAVARHIRNTHPGMVEGAAIYVQFLRNIKTHLHLVFGFDAASPTMHFVTRHYPALLNCCTLDWFDTVPDDDLRLAAHQVLHNVPGALLSSSMLESVGDLLVDLHKVAVHVTGAFALATALPTPVSPASFTEFLSEVVEVIKHRSQEYSERAQVLTAALLQVDSANAAAAQLKIELVGLYQTITEREATIAALEEELSDDHASIRHFEDELAVLSQAIDAKNATASELESVLQVSEETVLPNMVRAKKRLKQLQRRTQLSLASKTKPSLALRLVMKAICIIREITPRYVMVPGTGADGAPIREETYWPEAKILLADGKFVRNLLFVDPMQLTDESVAKLADVLAHESFQGKAVVKLRRPVRLLYDYVHAAYQLRVTLTSLKPQQEELRILRIEIEGLLVERAGLTAELHALSAKIASRDAELVSARNELVAARATKDAHVARVQHAQKLESMLEDNVATWGERLSELRKRLEALLGDALVAATFLVYGGPLSVEARNSLASKAIQAAVAAGLRPSQTEETFDLGELLMGKAERLGWAALGLDARDRFAAQNAVIMFVNNQRWPLLIDPSGNGVRWVRSLEGEPLREIRAGSDNVMAAVSRAVRDGVPVLLHGILSDADLPPALGPLLSKLYFTDNDGLGVRIGDVVVNVREGFHLYLATPLEDASCLTLVTSGIVGCISYRHAPTTVSLALGQAIADATAPSLRVEDKRDAVITAELALLEADGHLLTMLTESAIDALVGSDALLDELGRAKSQLLLAENVLAKRREALGEARRAFDDVLGPVVETAVSMYGAMSDLHSVNPVYRFSFGWFQAALVAQLARQLGEVVAAGTSGSASMPHTASEAMLGEGSEAAIDPSLAAELGEAMRVARASVFGEVSKSLFDEDALLFATLLVVRDRVASGAVSRELYDAFVHGPGAGDGGGRRFGANPAPEWLNDAAWAAVCATAGTVPGLDGLSAEVTMRPSEWRKWLEASEPWRTPLPTDKWQRRVPTKSFLRLVLVRCVRPDALLGALRHYIWFAREDYGPEFVSSRLADVGYMLAHASLPPGVASWSCAPVAILHDDGVDPLLPVVAHAAAAGVPESKLLIVPLHSHSVWRAPSEPESTSGVSASSSAGTGTSGSGWPAASREVGEPAPGAASLLASGMSNPALAARAGAGATAGAVSGLNTSARRGLGRVRGSGAGGGSGSPVSLGGLVAAAPTGSTGASELQRASLETTMAGRLLSSKLDGGLGWGPPVKSVLDAANSWGRWVVLTDVDEAPQEVLDELARYVMGLSPAVTHTAFRLFVLASPVISLPQPLLSQCVTLVAQAAPSVRSSVMSAFSHNGEKLSKALSADRRTSWRRAAVGVFFVHALVRGRFRFEPQGWSWPVALPSLATEVEVLGVLERELAARPVGRDIEHVLAFVRGWARDVAYGPLFGAPLDRWIVEALLRSVLRPEIADESRNFVLRGEYVLPKASAGLPSEYLEHVKTQFSSDDPASVFGLPDSVTSEANRKHVHHLLAALASLDLVHADSDSVPPPRHTISSWSDEATTVIATLAQRVPEQIPGKLVAVPDHASLSVKLVARQVSRYNKLLQVVHDSLAELSAALAGRAVLSLEHEVLCEQLLRGLIPFQWAVVSYEHMYGLQRFLDDLARRVASVRRVCSGEAAGGLHAGSVDVSILFAPRELFAAVREAAAAALETTLDMVEVRLSFAADEVQAATAAGGGGSARARAGLCVDGLWIQGAQWSPDRSVVMESSESAGSAPMPRGVLSGVAVRKHEDAQAEAGVVRVAVPVWSTEWRAETPLVWVELDASPTLHVDAVHAVEDEWALRSVALLCEAPNRV